jgi:hypothetical protein
VGECGEAHQVRQQARSEPRDRAEHTGEIKTENEIGLFYFCIFRVLGSLLLLILLGAFLAFSSLGAGLDEQMQTPLSAHQQRFR